MRKLLASLLMILTLLSLPASTYKHIKDPVTITSARMEGMGGAGLALASSNDALYVNPAGLASKRFALSILDFSATVYNAGDVYDSGVLQDWIDDDTDTIISDALDLIDSFGSYNKLGRIDAGLSLAVRGFGFGFAIQDTVYTYSPGLALSTSLIDKLNVMFTIGYGRRFYLPYRLTLDAGLSISFNYLAYNEAVGASAIANNYDDFEGYAKYDMPIFAGFSVPINAGLTLNTPVGISAAMVLSNINGTYYMSTYEGYSELLRSLGDSDTLTGHDFKLKTDAQLAAGLGWESTRYRLFRPAVALDFVDIVGLAKEGLSLRNLFGHARFGLEAELLTFLTLRGGISQGYWTLGFGIDFKVLRIDVAYFNEEYGAEYGTRPVDGLTVRVKLGLQER